MESFEYTLLIRIFISIQFTTSNIFYLLNNLREWTRRVIVLDPSITLF